MTLGKSFNLSVPPFPHLWDLGRCLSLCLLTVWVSSGEVLIPHIRTAHRARGLSEANEVSDGELGSCPSSRHAILGSPLIMAEAVPVERGEGSVGWEQPLGQGARGLSVPIAASLLNEGPGGRVELNQILKQTHWGCLGDSVHEASNSRFQLRS